MVTEENALVYQWNVRLMEGINGRCHTHIKIEFFQNQVSVLLPVNEDLLLLVQEENLMLQPLDIRAYISKLNGVAFVSLQFLQFKMLFQVLQKFYAKIFLVQRSANPLGLLSCSRPAWQRSILCSLPAFPPEVQLKFKSKRELLCISSLASVASVFNTNTLFEKQRVGRTSWFRSQDKGVLLFLQSYCEPRPCLQEIRAAIRSRLALLSPSP